MLWCKKPGGLNIPELPQAARLEAGGVPRDQPVISEFSLAHPGPALRRSREERRSGIGNRPDSCDDGTIVGIWLDAVDRENPQISLRFIIVRCVLRLQRDTRRYRA